MLKIKVDCAIDNALTLEEVKYVFETLCLTIGIPWHFVNEDFKGSVDVYYGVRNEYDCRLYIKANTNKDLTNKQRPLVIFTKDISFLDFTDNSEVGVYLNGMNGDCVLKNDIIYSIFYLITGKDEKYISRNKYDQHDISQSILYKNKLLHTPLFNQYVGLFEKLFSNTYEFIPKWENGKKAALALSHDVDYPEMIKWIEILRYILKHRTKLKLKTIINVINGKENFWKFNEFINLEKSYNAKSAFYFCPLKGNLLKYFLIAPNPFYDIRKSKFKKVVNDLEKNEFEIGLHSSYFAYKSLGAFLKEKMNLEREFQIEISGNRHHYWHMNPENPSETAYIHQQSGLLYDSSISFEKHSGFRYSICTPFNLWNAENSEALSILQLPPTLMDDHLFGQSINSSFSNYEDHISSLVKAVVDNEGVFVADFHARVLNSTFYPRWGDAYKYLLETICKRGDFYIDTPQNISKYWNQRIKNIKNISKDEMCYSN